MKDRDVANVLQFAISTGTTIACALLIGIPVAKVAFRHSTWLGLAVWVITFIVVVSPFIALLQHMSKPNQEEGDN